MDPKYHRRSTSSLSGNAHLPVARKQKHGWKRSVAFFRRSHLRTFHLVYQLSPLFSMRCALFCAFLHLRKTQPFCFQSIPDSASKNTTGGRSTALVPPVTEHGSRDTTHEPPACPRPVWATSITGAT